MQVWEIDGEYASVFDTYITDEIRGSFEDNYAIALGYLREDIYSYDEVVGSALLDGVGFEECPDYELPLNGSISKAASMNLAAIPAPYAASASVNITHVRNQQCDYADKHWLCRAACVAMMVNYRNGDSLTTKDVWRAMKTSSNPDPGDDIATVKGAFDKYDYSYNVYSKSISASEVLGALSLDKPVYIEINGNKTSDGSAVCHAVVICGISIDNATSTLANITYTVDDPTSGSNLSYIIKASPSEKVNNISYTPSGYKYTSIQRTIYWFWEGYFENKTFLIICLTILLVGCTIANNESVSQNVNPETVQSTDAIINNDTAEDSAEIPANSVFPPEGIIAPITTFNTPDSEIAVGSYAERFELDGVEYIESEWGYFGFVIDECRNVVLDESRYEENNKVIDALNELFSLEYVGISHLNEHLFRYGNDILAIANNPEGMQNYIYFKDLDYDESQFYYAYIYEPNDQTNTE